MGWSGEPPWESPQSSPASPTSRFQFPAKGILGSRPVSMKILLVFPPFYLEPMYSLPPLGLLNLATVLKTSPHQTTILDFPLAIRKGLIRLDSTIYEQCASRILEEGPDLVGFSVQCTTYPPSARSPGSSRNGNPGSGSYSGTQRRLCGQANIDVLPLDRRHRPRRRRDHIFRACGRL